MTRKLLRETSQKACAIRECSVIMRSIASVCVSVGNAVTSESIDLESLFFWYAGRSSEYPGQGQGHRSKASVNLIPPLL